MVTGCGGGAQPTLVWRRRSDSAKVKIVLRLGLVTGHVMGSGSWAFYTCTWIFVVGTVFYFVHWIWGSSIWAFDLGSGL